MNSLVRENEESLISLAREAGNYGLDGKKLAIKSLTRQERLTRLLSRLIMETCGVFSSNFVKIVSCDHFGIFLEF